MKGRCFFWDEKAKEGEKKWKATELIVQVTSCLAAPRCSNQGIAAILHFLESECHIQSSACVALSTCCLT